MKLEQRKEFKVWKGRYEKFLDTLTQEQIKELRELDKLENKLLEKYK